MKLHIELEDKDLVTLLEAVGTKFIEKLPDIIKEQAEEQEEKVRKSGGTLVEAIKCENPYEFENVIGKLNAMIDCTGTATLLDYIELASDIDRNYRDLLGRVSIEERGYLIRFGWNRTLSMDDVLRDETGGYYISGESIVKLTEQ